ncbi:MAG: MDR family MFS transporter [Corynebacterium sp.]|nr:MDR family MFS transporter [Corynebacterium sp.]
MTEPRAASSVWLAMVALMLIMLMSSLGQMIFATALPTIVGDLGGISQMSWVITAFLLAQTIFMPICGALADQMSKKVLLIVIVAIFMVGSAIGGFANSMLVLIVARAIQGAAGGGLMVVSQALTAEIVSARDRGKYMGVMGAVFGVSSVLGPVLGGWFTDGPGWRWGLWLNIPLGFIAIGGVVANIHVVSKVQGRRVDVGGILTMAVATSSLILATTWGGNNYPWGSWQILSLFALAAVFFVLFFAIEAKVAAPIIPPALFRARNFNFTTCAGIAVGIFMFGAMGYMPTFMQMVHALTPTVAGLMMTPMMVGLLMTSTLVGNLVTRYGRYKWYPVAGLVGTTVALILMGLLHAETSLWIVGALLFFFGLALGAAMQILVLIVQNTFPVAMIGKATASNNFFRQIGATLGASLVGGLFTGRLTDFMEERLPAAVMSLPPEEAAQFAGGVDMSHFTPAAVVLLSEPLQLAIEGAYADALLPIFLWLSPLALIAAGLLVFIREDPLKDTIE